MTGVQTCALPICTNESSVDVSGSVEGAGDGQTNTGTVDGP